MARMRSGFLRAEDFEMSAGFEVRATVAQVAEKTAGEMARSEMLAENPRAPRIVQLEAEQSAQRFLDMVLAMIAAGNYGLLSTSETEWLREHAETTIRERAQVLKNQMVAGATPGA